jgi:hypothetical protein
MDTMRGAGLLQVDYNLASPANRHDGRLRRDERHRSSALLTSATRATD